MLTLASSVMFAAEAPAGAVDGETFYIKSYEVAGASKLPRIDIEAAVYPFLGPGRTREDVELARAALEKAYQDQGFQTVAVAVPPQQIKHGIVRLQVIERTVGRLRVKGAKYSSPARIKALAPSLAEGSVIDFNQVPKDIVALNQSPDRQVTPSLRAGTAPDTVDVDLEVKEKPPVHASVELNNRRGPNTTPLRASASVSAGNLGQSGDGAGFSAQVSPQDTSQVKVFSGYYLAHFRQVEWLNLMLTATKQDSNVSTLGDTAVAGRGQTVDLRAIFNLPAGKDFSQSASVAIDYKHFDQNVSLPASGSTPASVVATPVTYYPIALNYSATWQDKSATTEFTSGVTFGFRGLGSSSAQFSNNRYLADANFLIFHGDLARTQEMPWGFQLYGKVQGQLADQPLLSGEQASGGGLGTARGYLEAEEVGDNAAFGTIEVRSPSLLNLVHFVKGEWRFYAFTDAGWLKVNQSLPGQKNHFDFLSYGFGTRLKLGDHFDASLIASLPQLKEGATKAQDWRINFKVGLDY